MNDNSKSIPITSKPGSVIIIRSGDIEHLKAILDYIEKLFEKAEITCIVQKEFEKAALAEKRISNIITMEKLGDYSFKFSLRALRKIRKKDYDLAIAMERAGNETRDRRTHLLTSFIKARQKFISISDGSFREFQLKVPLGNLLEVLLSNLLSLADLILAKLTHLVMILVLWFLKFLKKRED